MNSKEISVIIHMGEKQKALKTVKGRRFKELISDAGIDFAFPCGGNGRCGKCIVTFVSGAPEPGTADRNFLGEQLLSEGKRVLCRCVLDRDCVVDLSGASFSNEEKMAAETVLVNETESSDECENFGIAVDIGTTTVAAALVGLKKGKEETVVLDTKAVVNHQRRYGADVISRIEASADKDTGREMKELIRGDIKSLIEKLCEDNRVKELSRIVLSGNTTMLYLLQGYDAAPLGVYPYTADKTGFGEIILNGTRSTILPGISAFVGADIVSGLYFLGIPKGQQKALFVDLGTNGEMAFYDGTDIFVTSTAAGPVFEGGGISCGMASVPGAICHVTIEGEKASCETIEGAEAIGLCGTGVIEAVAELRRNELIDKDGLLAEKYFEEGYKLCSKADGGNIVVTQKDVRNVQLAKAAINAGMETILAGKTPDIIYIGGGFGTGINERKIRGIKLFSQNYCDNINVVGNSSLKGAVKYLENALLGKEDGERQKIQRIVQSAKEVVLAKEEGFDEKYIDALSF